MAVDKSPWGNISIQLDPLGTTFAPEVHDSTTHTISLSKNIPNKSLAKIPHKKRNEEGKKEPLKRSTTCLHSMKSMCISTCSRLAWSILLMEFRKTKALVFQPTTFYRTTPLCLQLKQIFHESTCLSTNHLLQDNPPLLRAETDTPWKYMSSDQPPSTVQFSASTCLPTNHLQQYNPPVLTAETGTLNVHVFWATICYSTIHLCLQCGQTLSENRQLQFS